MFITTVKGGERTALKVLFNMIRKITSYTLDHIGLSLLHIKKSQISHFKSYGKSFSIKNKSDLSKIYPNPNVPHISFKEIDSKNNYQISKFYFESPLKSDYDSNNLVSGTYYSCKSSSPIHVIFVHGWRMESWDKVNKLFLKSFQKFQFHIYQINLPFHFDRSCDAPIVVST